MDTKDTEARKPRPLCPILMLAGAVNEASYSSTSTMECIEGVCAWWVENSSTYSPDRQRWEPTEARCGIAR